MNAEGSTAKEANISIIKEPTLTIIQHIITFDISSSKDTPERTNSSSKPSHAIIDIDRQGQATCSICLGDYLPEELKYSLKCKHAFCSACLTEYLNVKINNNEVLDIPCPQSGCVEVFTKKSVKKNIPSKEYKKYQDLVTKKMMFRDRKKYCPQSGCSRLLNTVEGQQFTICECEAKICNACLKLDHEGKSCIEMIDSDFEKFAKENGVRFCMMCKTIVMKEDGCNIIRCAVCDYDWCWICGREYHHNSRPCPREWDPIPPASILIKGNEKTPIEKTLISKFKKNWREASVLKRIGICLAIFLLSPILLIGFVVFFPACGNDWFDLNTFDFESRKPLESARIVLGWMFFGLLIFPINFLAWLGLGLLLLISLPLMLLAELIEFFKRNPIQEPQLPQKPQLENRWQSRNPENFVYRPTDPHS